MCLIRLRNTGGKCLSLSVVENSIIPSPAGKLVEEKVEEKYDL